MRFPPIGTKITQTLGHLSPVVYISGEVSQHLSTQFVYRTAEGSERICSMAEIWVADGKVPTPTVVQAPEEGDLYQFIKTPREKDTMRTELFNLGRPFSAEEAERLTGYKNSDLRYDLKLNRIAPLQEK